MSATSNSQYPCRFCGKDSIVSIDIKTKMYNDKDQLVDKLRIIYLCEKCMVLVGRDGVCNCTKCGDLWIGYKGFCMLCATQRRHE